MIKVLFFAQLKEQLKCNDLTVSIHTPCTLQDLKTFLIEMQPN